MWGLNPTNVFADSNNKVLSGEFFLNQELSKRDFENLNDTFIETKDTKTILKVENDFYLVRPNSKLKFVANTLTEIIKGSVHAVFNKRENELKIKIPQGVLGVRGTSIFVDLEPKKQRSYFCNCYGHTNLYDKNGNLLQSTISEGHKSVAITDEGKVHRYGKNYLTNLYALRHPGIFEEEMEKVGCEVKNSHCALKT